MLATLVLTGCHGRAMNDLYSEHMAAEIRDLEDQLYEYDHQYRLLEQELEILRTQNSQLKSGSSPNSGKRSLLSPQENGASPLEFLPRGPRLPIPPGPALEAEELPLESNSVLETNPSGLPSASDELPSPRLSQPRGGAPGNASDRPEQSSPTDPNPLGSPPALPGNDQASPSLPSSSRQGTRPNDPAPPRNTPRFPSPSGAEDSFEDIEELLPPTIDPGIPTPPPLPAVTHHKSEAALDPEHNLELNLSRIEIPSSQTPANKVPARLAGSSPIAQATIQVATEKVTDQRVVELAFHPSLTRAINMDDRPDDDGLYLVLQPKNERGQMVASVADLTIIAIDPARDGDQSKIGRWEYSAADIQDKLQPIGSEQGIHLRLPWNGPDPSADRVIVFALFKFDNGRQVMGEKEIFLSSDGSHKTVWGPRAPKSDGLSPSPIRTIAPAGYSQPASNEQSSASSRFAAPAPQTGTTNPPSNPSATPANNVVRPASGSAPQQPAPPPY